MIDNRKKQNGSDELTPEQQELIRLLRQKAEDTPVPMALQPDMILQRLPDSPKRKLFPRLRIPSLKTISGAVAVLGACAAVLLTGQSGIRQYLNGSLSVSTPSEISPSESSVSSDENADKNSDEHADNSTAPGSEAHSEPGSISAPSSEESSTVSEDISSGRGDNSAISASREDTSIESAQESSEATDESDGLIPNGEPAKEITSTVDPEEYSTVLPSGKGEDYAAVYGALQKSVTPQNATQQYATAVLSAGISADGLQSNSQTTVVATDGDYFYVSSQNSRTVSVLKGSKSSGETIATINVQFETPVFSGLSVSSYAVTDCFYANHELFVVGTVSYSGSEGSKTISAISCYDVTDPASPKRIASRAQDGTMVGAVMNGSYLYVFSRYYPDTTVQQNNVAGYIPLFYRNGNAEIPSADNIKISSAGTDSYIVAAAYSSKNPQDLVSCAILQGCGKNFFLGESGLYLFEEESRKMQTVISGITYSAGGFTVTSEATVNGLLSNLTPPNEYGGTLRILTSSYGESNDTHLYIFDRSLSLLGKAESFVENSVLRSVRFDRYSFYYTLYGSDGQVYEMNLSNPSALTGAEAAEKEEEALLSVNAEGNYTVRLTGRKGRTELLLTLRLSGLEKGTAVLSIPEGYNENEISLQYLGSNLVCLIYKEGYNDICKVYSYGDDGLSERISANVPAAEDGKGYLQNGYFFLITSQRTLVFDAETGKQVDPSDVNAETSDAGSSEPEEEEVLH